MRLALTCASLLPSACRHARPKGTSSVRKAVMSRRTSGSAPSLMVSPQVVWGQKTANAPRRQPLRRTTSRSLSVTSIISSRRPVLTEQVSIDNPLCVIEKPFPGFLTGTSRKSKQSSSDKRPGPGCFFVKNFT